MWPDSPACSHLMAARISSTQLVMALTRSPHSMLQTAPLNAHFRSRERCRASPSPQSEHPFLGAAATSSGSRTPTHSPSSMVSMVISLVMCLFLADHSTSPFHLEQLCM